MKSLSIVALCLFSFILSSCDNHEPSNQLPATHAQHGIQIQHLTMLVEHAINMAAQGADLKQLGDAHADAMFKQSADLLRRAMSGSEMSTMHKGGAGASPDMQHLHDLGSAAFDLLDIMMSTPSKQFPSNASLLHHTLSMATEAATLNAIAEMTMLPELDSVMQGHSNNMNQAAMQILKANMDDSAYSQAVSKLLHSLLKSAPQSMQHHH